MLIEGTIAIIAFAVGVLFTRRRMRALLPRARALAASKRAPAPLALPERSDVITPKTLYALAGVLRVREKKTLIGVPDLYVVHNGRRYDAPRGGHPNPELLGTLLAQDFSSSACDHCLTEAVERIDIVDKLPVSEGMPDFGFVRRWAVCAYCALCGGKRRVRDFVFHGDMEYRTALEPFASTTCRLDAFKALAEQNGRLTQEIRWQILSEEYARLQPRTAAIAEEMNRLRRESQPPREETPSSDDSTHLGSIYG